MKFQTVILSTLLLVSSSAAQVTPQAGNNALQAGGSQEGVAQSGPAQTGSPQNKLPPVGGRKFHRGKGKKGCKKLGRPFNKKCKKRTGGPKPKQGAPPTPSKPSQAAPLATSAAPTKPQAISKRNILKTVVGIGKGLLGL